MTERTGLASAFLESAGWGTAAKTPLAGDASARRYFRLKRGDLAAVLMDAPADRGEDIAPFVRMARWLRGAGFSAPDILAEDADRGFLLLEDLGDDLFASLMAEDPSREVPLYSAAADFLTDLHRHQPPGWLVPYDPRTLGEMVRITSEWYLPALGADPSAAEDLPALVRDAGERLLSDTSVVCLRDFHAENLIWLPEREGTARVGVLDFQDAFAGHPAYDLVSLLQDARRDVPRPVEAMIVARFLDANGYEHERFSAAYALLGAQRNLRILGVFARLALSAGKPQYLRLIPRVWGYVRRNLAHPELAALARLVGESFPDPEPKTLRKIAERCLPPSP